MTGWWRRYLDWRQRDIARLVLLEDGFQLLSRCDRYEIRWDAIERVTAYKRDLYTVDMLCLLIQTVSTTVEINEEMDGYDAVEATLQIRTDLPPEWKLGVLFPAFDANAATLFEREAASA